MLKTANGVLVRRHEIEGSFSFSAHQDACQISSPSKDELRICLTTSPPDELIHIKGVNGLRDAGRR